MSCRAQQNLPESISRGNSLSTDMGDPSPASPPSSLKMNLHVGVLHYDPSFEPFPLLADPLSYEPNTVDISGERDMLDYWLTVLSDSIHTIMQKAVASESGKSGVSSQLSLRPAFAHHLIPWVAFPTMTVAARTADVCTSASCWLCMCGCS